MNNNQMNFDPMTGQPINHNINTNVVSNNGMVNSVEQNNIPTQIQTAEPMPINQQQTMQNIPTVEQSRQDFINNTQANSTAKKEEKKEGPNIAFIIILFVIIFAAIFFLFPYLQKTL